MRRFPHSAAQPASLIFLNEIEQCFPPPIIPKNTAIDYATRRKDDTFIG